MPFETIYVDEQGTRRSDLGEDAIAAAVAEGRGQLWVNIVETDATDIAFLERVFRFHPLSLQECLSERYQRPKVEDFGDHLFVMLHGIDHDASAELVVTTELDLFIGPSYVVSASLSRLSAIDHLIERARTEPRHLERGSAMLAFAVIDALVDSVFPTIDQMGEFADGVEEAALDNPHRALLTDILRLRRSALRVLRVLVPQRDILSLLSRGEYAVITREAIPYYRFLYDQMVRMEDQAHSVRDRADGALTTYLSAVGIRQNETMRVLSVVASIFLPLSIVTGVYGMNFEYMPGLGWRGGYFAVLALMLTVSGAVVWWFWARRWIGEGRQYAQRQAARALSFRVDPTLLRDAFTEASRIRDLVIDPRRIGRR